MAGTDFGVISGVCVCMRRPMPCQAVQYLETLNIMEGFDVAEMGHNSAATIHRFIEAAKLAQADRAEFAGLDDPPTSGLLSKEYAAKRRAEIGMRARPSGGERYTSEKMEDEVLAGDPRRWMRTECTTHFQRDRCRRQRGGDYAEPGGRVWVGCGDTRDGDCVEQFSELV